MSSEIEYPVYTVLNACRTYAYLKSGKILSKDEGGIWALENVPRHLCAVVMTALDAYRNDADDSRLSKEAVAEFAITMRSELKHLLPAGAQLFGRTPGLKES